MPRVLPLEKIVVLDNSYLGYLLSILRSRTTARDVFRCVLEELAMFMAYEIARELPTRVIEVETPLGVAQGVEVLDSSVVIVAILRAGIPMLNGMLRVLKRARVGFISAKRIEDEAHTMSFEVETKYISLPTIDSSNTVVIVDPMLATASTMCRAIDIVAQYKPRNIIIANVIAAKQGIENLKRCTSSIDVPIHLYTLSIDPELNDRGFIVPGLGDAGDRAYTL